MDNISGNRLVQDPLEARLTTADDRVRLNHWMPPQSGIVPLIRFRTRWYSVLWALPIAFVLLVVGVAVAQALRQIPEVQAFLVCYPGAPADARVVTSGFPIWLRVNHFLNLLFMTFIIRARVQILADHPGFTGGGTVRQAAIGFAFKSRCRPGGFGRRKMIH